MNTLNLIGASTVALALAAFSIGASADSDHKAAEVAAQQNATITLSQAITLAEQTTGGKGTEAEFEFEKGNAFYDIEIVMADGSEVEVEVDAKSGAILSQKVEHDND